MNICAVPHTALVTASGKTTVPFARILSTAALATRKSVVVIVAALFPSCRLPPTNNRHRAARPIGTSIPVERTSSSTTKRNRANNPEIQVIGQQKPTICTVYRPLNHSFRRTLPEPRFLLPAPPNPTEIRSTYLLGLNPNPNPIS